jgi:hypothetical protein
MRVSVCFASSRFIGLARIAAGSRASLHLLLSDIPQIASGHNQVWNSVHLGRKIPRTHRTAPPR